MLFANRTLRTVIEGKLAKTTTFHFIFKEHFSITSVSITVIDGSDHTLNFYKHNNRFIFTPRRNFFQLWFNMFKDGNLLMDHGTIDKGKQHPLSFFKGISRCHFMQRWDQMIVRESGHRNSKNWSRLAV